MNVLCTKCGHPNDAHGLEVEAVILNIEKYNETVIAFECETWEGGRICGCRYGTVARSGRASV